jgi:hypothetical protein
MLYNVVYAIRAVRLYPQEGQQEVEPTATRGLVSLATHVIRKNKPPAKTAGGFFDAKEEPCHEFGKVFDY